jgi:YVTN family beta-propeller protein
MRSTRWRAVAISLAFLGASTVPMLAPVSSAYGVNTSHVETSHVRVSALTPIPVSGCPLFIGHYGTLGPLAVTPNGQSLYVTCSDGSVIPVDLATDAVGAAIPIDPEGIPPKAPANWATCGPTAIAITPNSATAYVACEGYNLKAIANIVVPVDLATGTAGSPITINTAAGPWDIVITPNGKTVYTANDRSPTLTPISVASDKTTASIQAGSQPLAIAITPNGKTAYVTNANAAKVTPISLLTKTDGKPIVVGADPSAVAIDPRGKTAYVVNSASNTVTPISLATNTAGTPIRVGRDPTAIAITPNGRYAFVVNSRSNTVTPITLATGTAGAPIRVSTGTAEIETSGGIAVAPNGKTAYISDSGASGDADVITPIAIGG